MRNEIYIRLGHQGLVPEVTIKDVQKNIEKEDALYTQKFFSGLADFDYSKYHPLSDVRDNIYLLFTINIYFDDTGEILLILTKRGCEYKKG